MSTTISITSPANNGDPFPDTIAGTYAGFNGLDQTAVIDGGIPAPPVISVIIKNQGTGSQNTYMATVVPGPGGTSGTWSLAKPSGLTPGAKYTITATLGSDSDTKIDIQN